MLKSDLKIGYLVKYRNGMLEMVMPLKDIKDKIIFVDKEGCWMEIDDYDKQLKCKAGKEYDIIAVWGFSDNVNTILKIETKHRKLLWENKKEMTISEIEKELGYSIKIIKED